MAKLSLERVMSTSFRDIANPQPELSRKALLAYNRQIKLLGETTRLGIESITELIKQSHNVSPTIGEVVDSALADTHQGEKLYQPGCSAVIVRGAGHIIGVFDKPNPDPTLESYGPGLMWAMLKIGQEKYAAHSAGSSASLANGYRAVSEALTGKDFDATPHEQRHHIGGSSGLRYFNPNSPSLRRFEAEVVMAGVSGVLTTDKFRCLAKSTPDMGPAIEQAETTDVLGDFEGNLLAGSLDSTLSTFILEQLIIGETQGRFTDRALAVAAARHSAGINVH